MKIHKVGVIMNGVTGRMGKNQHLERSLKAIQQDGGVKIDEENVIYPDLILLGRNENKLRELARLMDVDKFSTNLDTSLSDPYYNIYFDAQITNMRVESVKKAVAAKKAVYCEKPLADNLVNAMELYHLAEAAEIKHGVVQDKLWLPGILKLKNLIDIGYFGEILSIKGDFGYWVFDGRVEPCQRPSWNYRKEDGGGIILDMYPHWRYVIDNLFGGINALTTVGACQVESRLDELGNEYRCTADDAAYAIFELENGSICTFTSSWSVRVRRDDLLTLQVDGTKGSAIAGLRKCWIQSGSHTTKAMWNPDVEVTENYFENWEEVKGDIVYPNAFRAQWEKFLGYYFDANPFPWNFLEGAKGVQLANLGYESWEKGLRLEVPQLIR
jgi:predicted dehydrogenase